MSVRPVALIFDIGKTTKKIVVFDDDFHVLEEQTDHIAEIKDDEGFPMEDLQSVTEWVNDKLDHYLSDARYQVRYINFSAYGASFVHLNSNGHPIRTFVNYLKPLPEKCKEMFLAQYDSNKDICRTTASPYLGLLNSGLQLYWLKHDKSDLFRSIATSLHFPQYFTYFLTGKRFTEITSVGCHTMLWDFAAHDYHSWVDKENIRRLFPALHNSDHSMEYQRGKSTIRVGIGVHDSSAALMPYLVVIKEKFLLLSSGTWNICFNPFNQELLTQDELSQDCLCYITFDGRPVKASRIFLGHEHELQQQLLASHFQVDAEAYKSVAFNIELFKQLKSSRGFVNFAPLGMEGTGPLLGTVPKATDFSLLKNFEEAQHHLIRQLVRWQKISIDLIDPDIQVKNIIVVGGFAKSKLFLDIMKRELPERKILISDHPRASALGAAWLVRGKESYKDKTNLLNVMPA